MKYWKHNGWIIRENSDGTYTAYKADDIHNYYTRQTFEECADIVNNA